LLLLDATQSTCARQASGPRSVRAGIQRPASLPAGDNAVVSVSVLYQRLEAGAVGAVIIYVWPTRHPCLIATHLLVKISNSTHKQYDSACLRCAGFVRGIKSLLGITPVPGLVSELPECYTCSSYLGPLLSTVGQMRVLRAAWRRQQRARPPLTAQSIRLSNLKVFGRQLVARDGCMQNLQDDSGDALLRGQCVVTRFRWKSKGQRATQAPLFPALHGQQCGRACLNTHYTLVIVCTLATC
jgi:hypothetical protein